MAVVTSTCDVGFMQLVLVDISSTNTYIAQEIQGKKKNNVDKIDNLTPPSYKNQNIHKDALRKEQTFTIFRRKILT